MERLLAALILVAGAFQLTRPGYSVDEEFTVFAVRGIQAHGLPLLPSQLLYDRGLAYSYASWLAGAISSSELPAYRALSLLSALASVLLVFTMVRRLATDRAALLAATLVAASMPFWATATTGRFYAPFLAVYMFGLWLVTVVHQRNRDPVLSRGDKPLNREDKPLNRGDKPLNREDKPLNRGDKPLNRGDKPLNRGDKPLGLSGGILLSLLATAAIGRWLHELAFTLAAIPCLCALLDERAHRRRWVAAAAAIVFGLVAAQGMLFLLHALEPASGETMVRRFLLWQILNLFEVPASRQYGVLLAAMVVAWLIVPGRAALAAVIALAGTAMVVAFSLARASNFDPLSAASVATVLSDGARYPLDMFRHLAWANPMAVALVLVCLVVRLSGAGGEWRPHERAAHLLWLFWVLWFGVIDSGITTNYLLLPVTLMLIAIAIDADAIVSHWLPPVSDTVRRFAFAVVVLIGVGLGVDQWRGTGSISERLAAARPTIHLAGIEEVRANLLPNDRIACTDELACLLLVGRIDYWLALDDFVRERFLVKLPNGTMAGVYTGARAAFRPGDLFEPNADGTLPDRVLIIDVFKDYPIGNSRSWVPRAIELDGLQVTPLLEAAQARVLQISPQQRNASR